MIRTVKSLPEVMNDINSLGDMVRQDYEANDQPLPLMALVPRSGLVLGDTISRMWGVSAVNTLYTCVEKVREQRRPTTFREGQFPLRKDVEGQNIVIFDAVCKSGETLEYIAERLSGLGALSVKTAVLYDKAKPGDKVVHQPDFYVARDITSFVVFPWEVDEHLPLATKSTDQE